MLEQIQKYWSLFWKFRSIRFMLLLEYRGNFFFWAFVSFMWTVFNFFFFELLVGAKGNLGGWTSSEVYILISTFTMIDAFTWSFFYHNMQEYVSAIFTGQLSVLLTKPIDPQYLLSVQDNSYTNIPRFFIGFAMLLISIARAGIHPNIVQVLLYVVFLILALIFIYSLWFIIATLSFWVERLENINEVIPATRRLWQVPKQVFTGITSTVFTVFLPFGLMCTLPSELLLGRASTAWLLYFAAFTIILFAFARWFFFVSIKKYSAVGS